MRTVSLIAISRSGCFDFGEFDALADDIADLAFDLLQHAGIGCAQRLLQLTDEDAIRDETMCLTRDALGTDLVGLFLFDVAGGCLRLEAGVGWQPGTIGELTIQASTDPLRSIAGSTSSPTLASIAASDQGAFPTK